MDSFGNSSQGSVPINPMMAMIQRQQQEQQQYEALSAGTTMGINSGISSSTTTSITQNTAMMTSQQSIPSSGNNNNSVPYSPQTIAYSQEQRQQETPVMTQQRPLHQSNEMFNTNRQNRPPYYDTQNAPYYPTFIPQQQLFNMGKSCVFVRYTWKT
ncbi:uncharacterized protein BX664DRAFT_103149 [Halteromyces radiatus]|uniref:uncharacterized protein n=1 Tax=Halteromyces radiatus TaxID=101107 RepID=UPI0022203EE9|nr:uncharacterized protein BX664DRAFT_103149 [Halteromyces radiatus]KAI8093228.1 hypothetical protein BX664DRAFT_103149 [Halteromyces radiatus]